MSNYRRIGKDKKELNAELNLTPFIDLLSTCVCFLLITAVWIEIAAIEIKQSHGTEAQSSANKAYELDVVYQNENTLRLNLKRGGKRAKSFKIEGSDFKEMLSNMSSTLKNSILKFNKKDIVIESATITPRSDIDYGNMVLTLDVLRKNQITNIGVLSTRNAL